MKINILTVFPEMFESIVNTSILKRAIDNGLVEINLINIRNFTLDKHKKTDDTTFGGGCGMVMTCQPIFDAIRSLATLGTTKIASHSETDTASHSETEGRRILYMSPRGKIMDQDLIEELSKEGEITILCGHYEGVDQRVLDYWNMQEVSIGDYVLTGGELAAMVLIDAVIRFVPDVLGNEESATEESIYSGLLEYDQYTKPREFEGLEVPEILLSGNHQEIDKWRLDQAIEKTKKYRPDLYEKYIHK